MLEISKERREFVLFHLRWIRKRQPEPDLQTSSGQIVLAPQHFARVNLHVRFDLHRSTLPAKFYVLCATPY